MTCRKVHQKLDDQAIRQNPLHAVQPQKTSLNDCLSELSGWYFSAPSSKSIALSASIEAMFNQLALAEENQSVMRFLW